MNLYFTGDTATYIEHTSKSFSHMLSIFKVLPSTALIRGVGICSSSEIIAKLYSAMKLDG